MRSARSRWIPLLALLGLLGCPLARAVEEQELKTAIVFNLLLFVEWPVDAGMPARDSLVLCVGPASVLNAPLKALHGRAVRSLRLDVRDVVSGASWATCQAVYIDASGPSLTSTPGKPVAWTDTLVISDAD